MAAQAALDQISHRLDTPATRTDVDQIKAEVKNLTQTFTEQLEKLEGRLFHMKTKTKTGVKAEKKKTEILTDSVKQQERRLRQTEREQNDLQQYTRRWNPQVYKVPEDKQRLQTTVYRRYAVSSATKSASQSTLLTSRWLTGWDSGAAPGADRPVIVRFFDREKRDEVLRNRRNLKRKVFVVGEDLTYVNYQVSMKATEHSATLAVWRPNGRILAKVKNGPIVRLNIHRDKAFKRAMSSNEMSAYEDN